MDRQIETLFKRYLKPTRRSHYVKKEYLSLWSKDGSHILTCRDKHGLFFIPNNLCDVCVEKDMYKMELLTNEEIECVKFFYKDAPDYVKEENDNYIKLWQMICILSANIDNEEYRKIANKIVIQAGEDSQSILESALDKDIKNCLLNCDESFLANENNLIDFGLYLFSQYLRTQNQKDKINKNLNTPIILNKFNGQINPNRMWKVLIMILSTTAAYTLQNRNKRNHICFIKSNKNLLLTSDQPIINIANNINQDPAIFYHPISPSISIIFPVDEAIIIEDDANEINKMNEIIINNSYRMIFRYDNEDE